MNTHDLLEVAIGMGFDCKLKFALDEYGTEKEYATIGYNGYRWISDCNIFNPTIGDLMEWLLTKGYFDLITQNSIEFIIGDCNEFTVLEGSLKENLLEIIFQVIKAEKEK